MKTWCKSHYELLVIFIILICRC